MQNKNIQVWRQEQGQRTATHTGQAAGFNKLRLQEAEVNWPFIKFGDYGIFPLHFKFFSFDSDSSGDICVLVRVRE